MNVYTIHTRSYFYVAYLCGKNSISQIIFAKILRKFMRDYWGVQKYPTLLYKVNQNIKLMTISIDSILFYSMQAYNSEYLFFGKNDAIDYLLISSILSN